MIDFAALIDRVLERHTRGALASFLVDYEHIEFGSARRLEPEEAALVLTTLDHFLLQDSLARLGVPALDALYERLQQLAAREDVFDAEDACRIRNACFDALSALKAMEARVSILLDHAIVLQERFGGHTEAANDR